MTNNIMPNLYPKKSRMGSEFVFLQNNCRPMILKFQNTSLVEFYDHWINIPCYHNLTFKKISYYIHCFLKMITFINETQ